MLPPCVQVPRKHSHQSSLKPNCEQDRNQSLYTQQYLLLPEFSEVAVQTNRLVEVINLRKQEAQWHRSNAEKKV